MAKTTDASAGIEKLVKLALKRHDEGIPSYVICFDDTGVEVPWSHVFEVSQKGKQGGLEYVEPTPGTGYFCHIQLKTFNPERCTFELAAPGFSQTVTFVQPPAGAATIATGELPSDVRILAVLSAIGKSLLWSEQ